MPAFRTVTVTEVLAARPGLTRVRVRGEGRDDDERAYVLTELIGPVAVGDEVVVNTTAVDLGLGTGGWHVVHWNLSRRQWAQDGPGHILKLRYTSLQADVGAAEEHDPDAPTDLGGTPVVACSLHSQVAVVATALGALAPGARVAYVMTDGGALPLALSDLVAELRTAGLVAGTVTTGHAFGGDHEAVSVASGLAVARHALGADVIVAGMGPGVVGTGSRLGFSGLDQATLLDAGAWLGGQPVACVRASDGDQRPRHRGVSHHTATVLDATRSGVDVVVPPGLDPGPVPERHTVVEVEPPDVAGLLAAAGLRVTTMGRGPERDPLFFAAAGAAAAHAASLLRPRP
ncbi:MAG TPA: DUF3866 family protein [Acidimicrobiales bacterium]|nr:DUF3866 family protein [Acidimicrobiales bacterium]